MNRDLAVVFIVGSSRSGTTMLNRSLGMHSAVLGLHELHFFDRDRLSLSGEDWGSDRAEREAARLLATADRGIWQSKPNAAERQSAKEIVARCATSRVQPVDVYAAVLLHLVAANGGVLVTDQTPRNVFCADALLERFPTAKVINLVRDPRAVLYSQRNRWRQRKLGASQIPLRNALRVFANYHPLTTTLLWQKAVKAGRGFSGHSRCLEIRYEKLVGDPEAELRSICRFIGVPFEAAMLDVSQVGSSHRSHSDARHGISQASVEAWREGLPDADTWICDSLTRQLRNNLGYPDAGVPLPLLSVTIKALLFPLHMLGVLLMNPRLVSRMARLLRRAP